MWWWCREGAGYNGQTNESKQWKIDSFAGGCGHNSSNEKNQGGSRPHWGGQGLMGADSWMGGSSFVPTMGWV